MGLRVEHRANAPGGLKKTFSFWKRLEVGFLSHSQKKTHGKLGTSPYGLRIIFPNDTQVCFFSTEM